MIDTRRFEAAGFAPRQAGDLAAAIADATMTADPVRKTDLRSLEQRLTMWLGSTIIVAVAVLFAALRYWPPH